MPPRGQKFARVLDRFDVEKDGARAAVEREKIEKIAQIHIDLVAERDHGGKPNRPLCRPIHEPRCDRA